MDPTFENDIRQKLRNSHGVRVLPPHASPHTHRPSHGVSPQALQPHPGQTHPGPTQYPLNVSQPAQQHSTPQQQPSFRRLTQQQRRNQHNQQAPPQANRNGSQARPPPHTNQRGPIDPNSFHRGGNVAGYYQQPQGPPPQLYNRAPSQPTYHNMHMAQSQHLSNLASIEVARVAMTDVERDEKEAFRLTLQNVVHDVCNENLERLPIVSLQSFGSFRSGFANAGSDMDLVIVLPDGAPHNANLGLMEDDLPRALEKQLLQLGYGARLLTRTRVPIIKICEKPSESLLSKLSAEREKWDFLPNEKKYPHLHENDGEEEGGPDHIGPAVVGAEEPLQIADPGVPNTAKETAIEDKRPIPPLEAMSELSLYDNQIPTIAPAEATAQLPVDDTKVPVPVVQKAGSQQPRRDRTFTRERNAGPLDFPKQGVGIQCDINFFNPLGLHNTQLLRCYALCDPRVTPMILFIKSWAKQRKINSSYSGTLSSYGYVLMVLHYLVNIAHPAILPNLQGTWRPAGSYSPPGADRTECDTWTVDFWRNEDEIKQALQTGQMSTNTAPLGSLLAGFFDYYSSMGNGPKFHWMQNVLSLRSKGGILSKEAKGWVKAKTEEGEGKRVQHRYLFCIEDPFELDHNVARTVTHLGIVAIRDEFRRAKRILVAVGQGSVSLDGGLFDELVEATAAPAVDSEWKVNDQDSEAKVQTFTAADVQAAGRQRFPAPPNMSRTAPGARSLAAAKRLDIQDDNAFPTLSAGPDPKNLPKPRPARGGKTDQQPTTSV
ncbi:hypothetical protein LTR62_001649 [Meristemomyces frigidus]|uniref:polynucleotide adenylyltransferase n=1 Tax=Meristemomyces frigidus TaxID=1508187 RepID=A0AAN7YB57_9PEZI|nr:hypothetical protein LTR62_001649 [Meristemomyces frigidus]